MLSSDSRHYMYVNRLITSLRKKHHAVEIFEDTDRGIKATMDKRRGSSSSAVFREHDRIILSAFNRRGAPIALISMAVMKKYRA